MVQLRDRAGQLAHHLTSTDVNKANGMQVIMQELEKSPTIPQLDRHKVDQHRKRLLQLKRYPNESMESHVTRGNIYKTQLQALDSAMAWGSSSTRVCCWMELDSRRRTGGHDQDPSSR